MDEALAIRIFYFAVAIFSISVVVLMLQSPYDIKANINNIKVANMQADEVISYEMNATDIYANFISSSVIAYDDYNKFINPNVTFIHKDKHNINAKEAIYKDNNITFINEVKYINLITNLRYNSNEIIYDNSTKILLSNLPFELLQNSDKILGNSVIYELDNNYITAKGVRGWFYK
ncbi:MULTISPECIES: hypothetical protein [Campylobacter]|uniref:LPS export ABC transporter periplasmic protein LptC n=1 Tax=Campylobacter porcelli TaxID=1660073 RepID=A0ABU7M3Y9_9BACT|nr:MULTISPECIES: hypothetical protein [unclassified Campylobacter]MCR8678921.1 LPS export ABC transporter periplasmic protein LptC [Campylobacter sp. RM19072]MCR8696160.1 LPS export ABC transporter periplasmic protein LptC [Campylobacter sp. RM19073]MEE3704970.1 LPS export ABC transporter periplasmic protein LptC [Campylobacter sp. CX2-8023-23]MEE3744420.1 LPS export ABC transporter periplasmic protein LptC [Campylobacter sp. CX2-4855-23]MEE3777187.1 LPS export ABC transporter periplasmic prot